MFKTTFAAVMVATLALTGCTFDDGYDQEDVTESLYSRLGTREALPLDGTSLVGVAAYDDDGNGLPCLQPDVGGGQAIMRTTESDLLVVEALEVELTDVVVDAGVIHGEEIHLTDIKLRLGTQLAIEPDWSEGRMAASGTGSADLLLDWAVLDDDGDHLPLATQKLRDIEFTVRAELAKDGTIRAEVMSTVEGRIGGFANRIELADFSMAVRASSEAVTID